MTINFKRINTKFLIIPLSLIMLSGVNNSIQAMDENYGNENNVSTNNNNNIINNNKLKEHIKFSDFKKLVKLLSKYDSVNENDKKEIYRKCTDFIKLLPQFIQNDASNINFEIKFCKFIYYLKNELTKLKESKDYNKDTNRDVIVSRYKNIISNAGEQIGIKMRMYYWLDEINKNDVLNTIDRIINIINNINDSNDSFDSYIENSIELDDSYFEEEFFSNNIKFCSNEFCLNFLLDYSYFMYLFDHYITDDVCKRAYKNFLKILNDYYSKNFNKDEYKKILRVMLSNCLICDFPFGRYENEFKNYTRSTYYVRDIIHFLIEELAKIEYTAGMRMPVKTISDKIINDSMLPCIKKAALQFRDLMILKHNREILKHNKIILELEKSENEDKYKLQYSQHRIESLYSDIQYNIIEIPDLINNVFNNERGIHIINMLYNINDIVHKATKELRKEEVMDTFSKKAKVGDKKITSKYIVKIINDYAGKDNNSKDNDRREFLVKIAYPKSSVMKQEVNKNNENKEVNINNKNENK